MVASDSLASLMGARRFAAYRVLSTSEFAAVFPGIENGIQSMYDVRTPAASLNTWRRGNAAPAACSWPSHLRPVVARLPERELRPLLLLARMLLATAHVVCFHFGDIGRLHFRRHELAAHAHGARRIFHVNHRAVVLRIDLVRGVRGRRGGAADQQRHRETATLHLAGDVAHFLQRGRDEARQADHVGTYLLRGLEDLVGGHHDSEIDDREVVALENDADDVLADVVHVTLDGGEHHGAIRLLHAVSQRFDERDQMRHGLFHTRADLTTCGRNICPDRTGRRPRSCRP